MTLKIERRKFVAALGGAAAWPLTARAQQSLVAVIGLLMPGSPEADTNVAPFRRGLSQAGYDEGRNLVMEYRWANRDATRLPELAAELVRRPVSLIATMGSTGAVRAAKAATATVPIVFSVGSDPVEAGLVASLNRPGGNVTGVTSMSLDLAAKRFGLLRELMPKAERFALLVNPDNATAEPTIAEVRAAGAGRIEIDVLSARTPREIDAAFSILAQKRPDALMVASDTLFSDRRVQVATLTTLHRLPAILPFRRNVEAGGLMSYESATYESQRLTGLYAGRILKGDKPTDLPILRAEKFELVLNLQTARSLGIEIPVTLLARADEVIE
jgi:putative ABC transport system substrate-binding protein